MILKPRNPATSNLSAIANILSETTIKEIQKRLNGRSEEEYYILNDSKYNDAHQIPKDNFKFN